MGTSGVVPLELPHPLTLQLALTVCSVSVGKVVLHPRLRNSSIVPGAFKNDPWHANIVSLQVLSIRQIFGASYPLAFSDGS
jgi:hypothetical protein